MGEKIMRKYEVSIWTLYDNFIAILENSDNKIKGSIENPILTLNIDGTQTFTFSIPMYYNINGKKYINPSWQNINTEKNIINTRKVKIILNKKTEEEEIYEFVIDKITERHSEDELYCDVECTGLAFYELGKIGYKITLSEEDFYNADFNWFQSEQLEPAPKANIQFWLNKFLTPLKYPINSSTWYYSIEMDWTSYSNQIFMPRRTDIIYEDEDDYVAYITAQTDIAKTDINLMYIDNTVIYKEKERMINLEESNKYNLTQDIAEIFNVYCKYIYKYDENYHIIGRIIVFYNSFLNEKDKLSITYRAQTSNIKRNIDSTELVTKMYVRAVEDSDNLISIIDVKDNYNKEDFLLNFDYLYSVGNIDEEQYNYISKYEEQLHNINLELAPLYNNLEDLQNKQTEALVRKTLLETSIQLDDERIGEVDNLKNSITDNTGIIKVTSQFPDTAVLQPMENSSLYYININKKGVIFDSVKIYKTLDSSEERLKNEITNFKPVYDEYNNLIQIENLLYSSGSKIIYLTYTYEPSLYYDNIRKIWILKKAKDENELEQKNQELLNIENQLNSINELKENLLMEKQNININFEKVMGSALREGYWQPENYEDCGDIYNIKYNITNNGDQIIGQTNYDSFIWDEDLFDGEQDIKYKTGIETTEVYYPCIDLSYIWDSIYNKIDELSFLFYDYISSQENPHLHQKIKNYHFNSEAILSFVKKDNIIKPVLLLIGAAALPEETLNIIKNNTDNKIGKIKVNINNQHISYVIEDAINITSTMWIDLDNTYKIVYPRVRIENLSLKINEKQLCLKYGEQNLFNYEDYYLNTKIENSSHLKDNNLEYIPISSYYITVKPSIFIKNQFNKNLSILFTLSNADSSIYKDAKTILKESSMPKVEYELDFNIFKKEIILQPSKYLNHIVNINDYELYFKNVRGYISEITLNLDQPWQDSIGIKNYKSKFEDLFSSIVAQTEEMKKNSYALEIISDNFSTEGNLLKDSIQKSLQDKNLNYSFNNGNLTIDEENGILAKSENGVVSMRSTGIFFATNKDDNGEWIWNTCITPEGLNGNSLNLGQINTNKIKIFAENKVRLQMNEEGLFAYKSYFNDLNIANNISIKTDIINNINELNTDVDSSQYVKFNEDGLFLIAKNGAKILKDDGTNYSDPINIQEEELKRVSISWDGLTLRNYQNNKVFFADADTGNLTIEGKITANSGQIGPWQIGINSLYNNFTNPLEELSFGDSNGIYFGKRGLSLFGLFNVEVGEDNGIQRFKEFIIKNSENEDDYMIRIKLDSITNRYEFNLKQVVFGDDIKTILESNLSRVKRCFFLDNQTLLSEYVNPGELLYLYTPQSFSGGSISNLIRPSSSNNYNTYGNVSNVKYWNTKDNEESYIIGALQSQTEAYGYVTTFSIIKNSNNVSLPSGHLIFSYVKENFIGNQASQDFIVKLFDENNVTVFTKKITLPQIEEVGLELQEQGADITYQTNHRHILIPFPQEIEFINNEHIFTFVFYSTIPGAYITISTPEISILDLNNSYHKLYLIDNNDFKGIVYDDNKILPNNYKIEYI